MRSSHAASRRRRSRNPAIGAIHLILVDYIPWLGWWNRVTIPPLSPSKEVPVCVVGDRRPEPDEQFFLRLVEPENGVLGDAVDACTITSDDTR